MFKALKYPIFHQMFIQWTLSPIDLTTYNTNLRLFDIHARGLVQVSPKICGNKIHKSSEFIVLHFVRGLSFVSGYKSENQGCSKTTRHE